MDEYQREQEEIPAEIVRYDRQEGLTPLLSDEQIALAERNVKNVLKVKRLALSVTSQYDWCDLGGKPYLTESGAMKVAQLFGVSFERGHITFDDEDIDGRHVRRYRATITARYGGSRSLEEEGWASSDDAFFGRKNGQDIPWSEVNLNNVAKKALTNAKGRALKKILGLGGMTWDDVRSAGVDRGRTAAVDYSRGRGASATAPASSAKVQLQNMIVDLEAWTGNSREQLLDELCGFNDTKTGKRRSPSFDTITENWAVRSLSAVKKAWESNQGPPDDGRVPGEEG